MKKVYVLAKRYPEMGGAVLFVCGDPRMPTFDPTPGHTFKFEEVEDALLYRSAMPHQLGGTDKYRVYELTPDGQLIGVRAGVRAFPSTGSTANVALPGDFSPMAD